MTGAFTEWLYDEIKDAMTMRRFLRVCQQRRHRLPYWTKKVRTAIRILKSMKNRERS